MYSPNLHLKEIPGVHYVLCLSETDSLDAQISHPCVAYLGKLFLDSAYAVPVKGKSTADEGSHSQTDSTLSSE